MLKMSLTVEIEVAQEHVRVWQKTLAGAREAEFATHGSTATHKVLVEADRVVCGIGETFTFRLTPNAASVVLHYVTDTIRFIDENPLPPTGDNWEWCSSLVTIESQLEAMLYAIPAAMLEAR